MIDDLSPSRLRSFLQYLDKERGCGGATRNLRLAAIHSLAKFIGMRSPEHVAWSTEIRAVPFKKTPKASLTYLDKPEIDALLKAADLRTPQGEPRLRITIVPLQHWRARGGSCAPDD